MNKLVWLMLLMFCAGCSQHKLYVIGANQQQFHDLQTNLKGSGIQVINKNNLSSDFDRLTLVSAISYPIGTIEQALDQVVHTSLAQQGNQFYTDSAGLYFPSHEPAITDIYTNACDGVLITLTTYDNHHFKLTVEKFIEDDNGSRMDLLQETHGQLDSSENSMRGFSQRGVVFVAESHHLENMQTTGLTFSSIDSPFVSPACHIVKRKWSH